MGDTGTLAVNSCQWPTVRRVKIYDTPLYERLNEELLSSERTLIN